MPDQSTALLPHGPITAEQDARISRYPEQFVRSVGYHWNVYWCPGSTDMTTGAFIPQPDACPTCDGGGVTYTNPEEPGPDEITCETCGGTGATE